MSVKDINWISNKILAGRYNQPRVLKLKLKNKSIIDLDLDKTTETIKEAIRVASRKIRIAANETEQNMENPKKPKTKEISNNKKSTTINASKKI